MALVASEVRVAGTGGMYKGPLGTPKPATSVIAVDAAYEELGYFSSDGLTMGFSDSVENFVAWQNAVVIRSSLTETLTTCAFTPIQTRGSVLEAFHRGSTMLEPTTGNFELAVKPPIADPSSWVFDAIDGGIHIRYYIPIGEITERGDIMHQNGESIGYPMTMTFYPDVSGNLLYAMSDDPAWGIGI